MFNLPNLLTLANLFCGSLAIILIIHGEYAFSYLLFAMCLIFDLLDGMLARLMKTQSKLGKELDSLADIVSFGVLPGIAMVELLSHHSRMDFGSLTWPMFVGLLFIPVAALRLAKFNIDERQSYDFLGLNTPAATVCVIGMHMNTFWVINDGCWSFTQPTLPVIIIVFILLCLLMLSELPMISLKRIKGDKARMTQQIILLAGIVLLVLIMHTCSLPFLVAWYVLLSLILMVFNSKKTGLH